MPKTTVVNIRTRGIATARVRPEQRVACTVSPTRDRRNRMTGALRLK